MKLDLFLLFFVVVVVEIRIFDLKALVSFLDMKE